MGMKEPASLTKEEILERIDYFIQIKENNQKMLDSVINNHDYGADYKLKLISLYEQFVLQAKNRINQYKNLLNDFNTG